MNYPVKIYLLPLLAIFLWAESADAQWARGKGDGYLQVSVGGAVADQRFNSERELEILGQRDNPDEFSEIATYLYFEYGLTPNLTLVTSTFAKRMRVENNNTKVTTTGLSDLVPQLRYSFSVSNKLVISPQFGVKIPTGYDKDDSPPLGSGEVDYLISTQAGYSLHPLSMYIGSSFGFKKRGGIQADEFFGHIEIGYQTNQQFLLRVRGSFIESVTGTSNMFDINEQNNAQAWVKAGPGITLIINDHWQANLDPSWTVDGRTTAQIFSLIGGIAYEW